jgi:hypothetical protein
VVIFVAPVPDIICVQYDPEAINICGMHATVDMVENFQRRYLFNITSI